jgi:cytidylate kinase
LKKFVIAIDGPAASGKSTTARLTAERLGYLFVDTGAMYRAMTLKVLQHRLDPQEKETVGELAAKTRIELHLVGGKCKVVLDGKDVTDEIRSPEVTRAVSAVSAIPKVREMMVREQKRIGEQGGVILEGRDIGTVVFPDADLKIFMQADVGKRAQRRQKELAQRSVHIQLDDLQREIHQRDEKDSQREVSPLRKADDAVILDTSDLSIEEQVEFIIKKVKELPAKHAASDGR